MSKLQEELTRIAKENQKKEFNIFSALYRNHEEQLHSRFISFLLSSKSSHGEGAKFLNTFLEQVAAVESMEISNKEHHSVKLTTFKPNDYTVQPNEEDKREYKNIDIFICNNEKQVLIIENKIFARDSTHLGKENGDNVQLNRYCNMIKDEDPEREIFAVYLTLDGRKPDYVEEIKYPLFLINYRDHIRPWIKRSIELINNSFVKGVLEQYIITIGKLVNDVEEAKKLQELISQNLDEVSESDIKNFNKNELIKDELKHVKWHTIDDFWRELAQVLQSNGAMITKDISPEDITKIVHQNKKNKPYGINFKVNDRDEEWYVVSDKKGLTLGQVGYNKNYSEINPKVKFYEFNNKETFDLINKKKRWEEFNEIILKLNKEYQLNLINYSL